MNVKRTLSSTWKRNTVPKQNTVPKLLLLLALLLLTGCGGAEIGIETTSTVQSTATPPPTRTPTSTPTDRPTETPTATATTKAATTADWQTYSDAEFGVALEYPAGWAFDAVHGGVRYAGEDGFFILDAIGSPGASIDQVAADQAGHHLRPYGSQPTIESLEVAGQEARLILPSADATMDGQAMLIVRYPRPRRIGASGHAYEFFVLYADQDHIRGIARTLQFVEDGT